MRTATVTIDTAAITHNLQQAKNIASNSKVLAMVKADAYGHGIANCLPALCKADGIGVASFEEAKQARALSWKKTIVLIEGTFTQTEWRQSLTYDCQSVIHHLPQVDWALKHQPTSGSPSRTVWLKLNTGMNRLGFKPTALIESAKRLKDAGYQLLLMSHFANADDINHPVNLQQIQIFKDTLTQLHQQIDPNIQASLCNSAGMINFPDCHYEWVRPGIMLYGSSPLNEIANDVPKQPLNLQAAMMLQAKLIAIDTLASGDGVGYGSRFIADKDMLKGVVSIGYGDGYPRVVDTFDHYPAWVGLHHNDTVYRCPIIGRVSMDMLVIDVNDVPNPTIGSVVTLWGDAAKGVPTVDEIACAANTIGYELLCRLTQRPVRKVV